MQMIIKKMNLQIIKSYQNFYSKNIKGMTLKSYLKKIRNYYAFNPQYVPHFNGESLMSWSTLKFVAGKSFITIWGLTIIEICKIWIVRHRLEEFNNYFIYADNYLSNNCWLNFLLTLTIFLVLSRWLIHIRQDRYLSLNRIVISILMINILAFGCTFSHIESFIHLDYLAIIEMSLIVQIVLDAKKVVNKRWRIGVIKRKKLRYITEQPQEGLDLKVRVDYAKKVTELLLNTDISEVSFAMGITGEWGSGKTSFLLDMKNAIKDKSYIVDFKPWHCQEPNQIVNEFFEVFRKEIKGIYSPLCKPIIRYVQLLTDAGLPSYLSPLFSFLPQMSHSIDEYKIKIEKGLKQIDRPIIVTIDDMDRLAADEMFEVLRLIRNTAAFPNLIFIVCYDKDYVIKQIQEKGISDSDHYLDKIFPLELSLPMTEDSMLIETLRLSLIYMHYNNGKYSLIDRLSEDDKDIIVRMLPTYRKIKRFARVLVTNSMFIVEKLGNRQVNLYDLFHIELVHFCMNDVYTVLRDEPESILDVKKDEQTNQVRYHIKDNYIEILQTSYIFRTLSKYESKLLEICFSKNNNNNPCNLIYVDAYLNYFCMATPNVIISKEEFSNVVNNRGIIRYKVHCWFWKNMPKRSASLFSKMMGVQIKQLALEEWKNHVFLIASWICESDDPAISDVLCQFLLTNNLHIEVRQQRTIATNYTKEKLTSMICGTKVNRINMSKVLCNYYKEVEPYQNDFLINCTDVIEMLKQNFLEFMKEKHVMQDAINVMALNGNVINKFVKANHISNKREYDPFTDENAIIPCENLIIDAVIEYFSAYENKSSHLKNAKEIYKNSPNRYKNLQPWESKINLEQEKMYVFGSEENYEKFLRECFIN